MKYIKDEFDASKPDLISPSGKTAALASSKKRRVKRAAQSGGSKKSKKGEKKSKPMEKEFCY